MGGVLSCICAEATCCCVGGTCKACSSTFSCGTSRVTRIVYAVVFFLCVVISVILRARGAILAEIPSTNECSGECWNHVAVDRMSFGMVLFHMFLMVCLFGVTTSRSWRAPLQNALWPIKICLLLIPTIGAFYLPVSTFYNYWIAALVFSCIFIVIQSMLLVELSHATAENWLSQFENGSSSHQGYLIMSTMGCYAIFIILSGIDYGFFTKQNTENTGCKLNTFFVTFNIILVAIVTFISILPKVREHNPRSGLLQSGVISLYSTYLVSAAVSDDPYKCNEALTSTSQGFVTFTGILGITLTLIALVYAAFSTASDTALTTSPSYGGKDEEQDGTFYNYSWFHFIFMLASFYMASVLTNWTSIDAVVSGSGTTSAVVITIDKGISAMWVKVATSWAVVVLYIWTLVAPALFPSRNFGYGY